MADVAARAGVSPQTVSRVSNGLPNVTAEKRQRVLDAMRAIGYRPNGAARALKYGRHGAIGVIVHSIQRYGEQRTVDSLAVAARKVGMSVNLVDIETTSTGKINHAIRTLTNQAIDGLVVLRSEAIGDDDLLVDHQMPLVVFDNANDAYATVSFDVGPSVRRAIEHLLMLGHETVHHITGPGLSVGASHRLDAWQQALADHQRKIPDAIPGDWTAASGYRAGIRLLADSTVTAVFCANDELAMGFIRAAYERGIKVPDQISVIGFDDQPHAEFMIPSLTTISVPWTALGEICMDSLLQQMNKSNPQPQAQLLGASLIVRQSTAPPPSLRR